MLRELCMIPAGRHVVHELRRPARAGSRCATSRPPSAPASTSSLPRSPAVPASTNQGVPLLQSGAARPDDQGAAPAGGPLRRDPAHAAEPLPRQHRAGGAVNLAAPASARRRHEPGRPPRSARRSRRPPRRAVPRAPAAPSAVGPARAAAARRPTHSPGSRTASARRCSSAWAPDERPARSTEEQLRALVLAELDEVVEEENVPLSAEERHAPHRRAGRRRARPRPAAAAARRRLGHRDHGQRARARSTSSSTASSPAPASASPPRSTCAGSSSASSPGSAGASTSPRRWSTPACPTAPASTRSSRRWRSAARR